MSRIENSNLLRSYLNVDFNTLNNIYKTSETIIKIALPNSPTKPIFISSNIKGVVSINESEITEYYELFPTLISPEERENYEIELNKFAADYTVVAKELSHYRLIVSEEKSIHVKEKVNKIFDDNNNVVALFSEITNAEQEVVNKKFRDTIQILTSSLLGAKSIEDFYPFIRKIFADVIFADNYYLVKVEEDEELNFILFYDEKDKSPGRRKFRKGLTEYLLNTAEAVIVNGEDIEQLNRNGEIEIIGEIPVHWAGMPVIVDSRVWGAIVMQRYDEIVPFSEMEINLLEFIADRISFVIKILSTKKELITSESNLRSLAEELEALHKISSLMSNINYPQDEIFNEIVDVLEKTLGSSYWVRLKSKEKEFASDNYIKRNLLFAERIETPDKSMIYLEAGKANKSAKLFNRTQLSLLSETVNKLKDYLFRRKAAIVIRESEYKFRSIIQFAIVAIIITDSKGQIIEANHFANKLFRYDSNEFKKLLIFDIIEFEDSEKSLEDYFSGVEEESELTNVETTCIKKGDEKFFAEYSLGSWVFNNSRFYTFFISDISQRKQEENLRQFKSDLEKTISEISSEFLKRGLSNFSEAFNFAMRRTGEFFSASRVSFFTIDKENESISCLYEWHEENVPAQIEKAQNFHFRSLAAMMRKLSENRVLLLNENNADRISLTIMNARQIKSAILISAYIGGELSGFIIIEFLEKKEEIESEVKLLLELLSEIIINSYLQFIEAEEKERTSAQMRKFIQAVEQSESSIVITDIKGNIEYVNPAFEMISGYNESEVIGENPRILKSGHTTEEEYKELWDTITSGKTWRGRFKNKKKDGTFYWEDAIISPVKNKSGKIVNFIGIKDDVTEKLQVENQIALMRKMEAIGELAAGIAHEINTPMQFIGDNTNFLKESFQTITEFISKLNEKLERENTLDELTEFVKEEEENADFDFLLDEIPAAIEQTLEGIDRVSKIVKAVKEFSHKSTKEKVFADLNKSIESTVVITRNEWKYVADIDLKLEENLPPVECVVDEINQVLLNITVNAAQAIAEKLGARPTEKGKITFKTEQDEKFVIIKISDTGSGIPQENLDKIFDPFFTTKDVGKGTGQGLAIAHDIIVNKHQGILEVNSKVGTGSTFIIKLPKRNVEDK